MRPLAVVTVAGVLLGAAACGAAPPFDRRDGGPPADATGDSGPADAMADAGPTAGLYGGRCDAPFPDPPREKWRHRLGAGYATSLGGPNHRVRDLVLKPGEASRLRGRFTYGAVDKDLEDEVVELWFRRCPSVDAPALRASARRPGDPASSWEKWGRFVTDHDGIAWADVPGDLPPGDYRVRFFVPGDGTSADGTIAVWRRGMKAIVSDIDGTLTTSDWQLFNETLTSRDAEMYPDADTAIRRWVAKGYRVVYVTGRVQVYNRYSRQWLARHAFPDGPIFLVEQAQDALPADEFVREFKALKLLDLAARVGVEWRAAYGNATTDVGAYADASIPLPDTYIIGPHAGGGGTVGLSSYTAHLPALGAYPDAVQP